MVSSSEEEEEEEEENVSDMKTLTSGGGDLPQEFWQVQGPPHYLPCSVLTCCVRKTEMVILLFVPW